MWSQERNCIHPIGTVYKMHRSEVKFDIYVNHPFVCCKLNDSKVMVTLSCNGNNIINISQFTLVNSTLSRIFPFFNN